MTTPALITAFTACLAAGTAFAAPEWLSETGLYAPGTLTVREDIVSFSPQYPLWSDGASKRRFMYLPPGISIDASRPDAWEFPVGTRFWKEFSVGRPVETRLIEHTARGEWSFATYVWQEDGRDAKRAPDDGIAAIAIAGAPNGRYAIPSAFDCRACHEGTPVPVLGFSALQLSPDRDPLAPHAEPLRPGDLDLPALIAAGLVRNLPEALGVQPPRIAARTPVERAALGYLHGNCGHCHGEASAAEAAVPVGVRFAQYVTDPNSPTMVLQSLVEAPSRFRPYGHDATSPVTPGMADQSLVWLRMAARNPYMQMPPLGTAVADADALALIEQWINHDLSRHKETP